MLSKMEVNLPKTCFLIHSFNRCLERSYYYQNCVTKRKDVIMQKCLNTVLSQEHHQVVINEYPHGLVLPFQKQICIKCVFKTGGL